MNLPAQSANQIPDIQEIAIAISIKDLNPTMLSQEFLKFSGIVPKDWEVTKQPVVSPRISQISFKNGVTVVAQPGMINFAEGIGKKKELNAPLVARNYVQKMPNADYQGISISPKSLFPLPEREDAARNFISQTLLAAGPWQQFGKGLVQAGINLLYQLEQCQFSMSINEARLQQPDKTPIPALLFAGSFNYNLAKYGADERLEQLTKIIQNWQTDFKTFRQLVNQRFLKQQKQEVVKQEQESLFPSAVK